MKRLLILAPAILLVASCSRGPDRIQAGQWEMTFTMTSLEVPGAPPEAQARMRQGLNRPETNRACISAEQAANPMAELRRMMSQNQQSSGCRFTDETYGGGVIRIHATCQQPGSPARGDVAIDGTFTTTTLDATLTASGQGLPTGGGAQSGRIGASIRGRRVADCPTPPAPAAPR